MKENEGVIRFYICLHCQVVRAVWKNGKSERSMRRQSMLLPDLAKKKASLKGIFILSNIGTYLQTECVATTILFQITFCYMGFIGQTVGFMSGPPIPLQRYY